MKNRMVRTAQRSEVARLRSRRSLFGAANGFGDWAVDGIPAMGGAFLTPA